VARRRKKRKSRKGKIRVRGYTRRVGRKKIRVRSYLRRRPRRR